MKKPSQNQETAIDSTINSLLGAFAEVVGRDLPPKEWGQFSDMEDRITKTLTDSRSDLLKGDFSKVQKTFSALHDALGTIEAYGSPLASEGAKDLNKELAHKGNILKTHSQTLGS